MENINEIVLEEFPIKDRSSRPGRRKKTYFKGKQRYDRARQKGFTPYPEKESVLRGMMRKTCVINANVWKGDSRFDTDRGTVRRQRGANDKLNDYAMED